VERITVGPIKLGMNDRGSSGTYIQLTNRGNAAYSDVGECDRTGFGVWREM